MALFQEWRFRAADPRIPARSGFRWRVLFCREAAMSPHSAIFDIIVLIAAFAAIAYLNRIE